MKRGVVPGLCILVLCCAGAFPEASPNPGLSSIAIQGSQSQANSGPRARISVAEIKDKTAAGGLSPHWMERFNIPWKEIGDGMREMLTTALFKTKRFAVVEREAIDEVIKEQDLAASGRVQQGTGATAGGIHGADLIIAGAVTEFVADALTVKGGADAWGTQVDGSMNKGYVTLDLRVIDAKTSEIVAATRVTGRTSDIGLKADPGEEAKLPISLSVFGRRPAERAIRSAIQKAVADIIRLTPPEYFRN
jgi:curli biogenesis system outer membrane secretion channel CsgG